MKDKRVDIDITEHKAPTDESIRLLNEMQEKAKENILKTVYIDENNLKAVCVYYLTTPDSMMIECHIRFNLNGVDYTINHKLNRFQYTKIIYGEQYLGMGVKVLYDLLIKTFSDKIAETIVAGHNVTKNLLDKL